MGLEKLFNAIDGKKTYILATIGISVSLAGHFWGPFNLAGGTVPKESWSEVWKTVYASGLIAFLRNGVSKAVPPKKVG